MSSMFSVVALAFLFGLRHGIDWDHLAAITDITTAEENKKQGFIFATFYIFGHALVVTILGTLVIFLGAHLPEGVDVIMEKIVGVTLIFLGLWLLYSIFRHGGKFRAKSRWMLILHGLSHISGRLHHLFHHHPPPEKIEKKYGSKAAFLIGMIHGIGAETPTQVLLFVTASGLKKGFGAELLLLVFVVGLIISNSIIACISLFGYNTVQKNPRIYVTLGVMTAVVSLYIGIQFLLNGGTFLPALLGG